MQTHNPQRLAPGRGAHELSWPLWRCREKPGAHCATLGGNAEDHAPRWSQVPRHASALYSHHSRARLPRMAPIFKQSEDQGRPQTLPSPGAVLGTEGKRTVPLGFRATRRLHSPNVAAAFIDLVAFRCLGEGEPLAVSTEPVPCVRPVSGVGGALLLAESSVGPCERLVSQSPNSQDWALPASPVR